MVYYGGAGSNKKPEPKSSGSLIVLSGNFGRKLRRELFDAQVPTNVRALDVAAFRGEVAERIDHKWVCSSMGSRPLS